MYDLGDTVTLARDCLNAAGALANCTTATLTVSKPDGTTDTPTITNPPTQTGKYTVGYVPTQHGRHAWRMTFTGAVPDQAYTDVFHVWPTVNTGIVGLAETKDFLNIDQATTTHDEELRRTIAGVSAVVEGIVGAVARRTVTEVFSGRGSNRVYLAVAPAISVTSVVEDGTTLAAASYSLHDVRAVLTRLTGRWAIGTNNVAVTYVVGRPVVQDNILDGTRDLIRVNFRPQLGGNRMPFDTAGPAAEPGQIRLGFFVPNSVMERLTPSGQGPFYL